ncbi:MAG: hydrogenase maturation nickel metallochaperone HypA [Chloroflexota bacterium]
MHELPVTQSILEIALKHAQKADARRVTNLYIIMGELSTLVDDSIQFYWDLIAEDTIAKGATLHFERVPAELQCLACSGKFTPNGREFSCPACGSINVKVISGEEFSLAAIDVE